MEREGEREREGLIGTTANVRVAEDGKMAGGQDSIVCLTPFHMVAASDQMPRRVRKTSRGGVLRCRSRNDYGLQQRSLSSRRKVRNKVGVGAGHVGRCVAPIHPITGNFRRLDVNLAHRCLNDASDLHL